MSDNLILKKHNLIFLPLNKFADELVNSRNVHLDGLRLQHNLVHFHSEVVPLLSLTRKEVKLNFNKQFLRSNFYSYDVTSPPPFGNKSGL